MSIYNNIYEILEEYNHLHPTSNFGGDRPHAPLPPPKFSGYASRPADWGNSESTVTVLPSTAVFFHGTYRGAQSVVPPNTNTDRHTDAQTQTDFIICPMLYAIAMGQIKIRCSERRKIQNNTSLRASNYIKPLSLISDGWDLRDWELPCLYFFTYLLKLKTRPCLLREEV